LTEPVSTRPKSPADQRLEQQLRFLVEIDRLKTVRRRTLLTDRSRRENSAEHSWHIALMALLLSEYAEPGLDVQRVVSMLLVHDLVEIDAGDTFAYDVTGNASRVEREQSAADRLFGLLPDDQCSMVRELWDEFEAGETPESRFALAVDRLQPLLQNVMASGGTWRSHGVTMEQVLERMSPLAAACPALWRYAEWAVTEVWVSGIVRDPEAEP
jgi:putative hydrolase of HD superfamily